MWILKKDILENVSVAELNPLERKLIRDALEFGFAAAHVQRTDDVRSRHYVLEYNRIKQKFEE